MSSFVAHVGSQTDAYYLYWNIESGAVKYICPSFWYHKSTDHICSCSITRGLIWRWTRGLMDCFDISFHSKAFTIRDYTRMWYSKNCFEYSKEYLRIMNVAKEKEYATLSNGAIVLKLAVYPVIQSIRNNSEQYISLIWDNYSSANYNIPSSSY